MCVSVGKKCSFFGKNGLLCFIVAVTLRVVLVLYYRRFHSGEMRDSFFQTLGLFAEVCI